MERRVFSRVDCNVEAVLTYAGESFPSRVVNLSLGGVLINTAASPKKGEEVGIVLSTSRGDESLAMHFSGRVARADARGLGIAFDPGDPDSLAQLRDLIAEHSDSPQTVYKEFARAVQEG